MIQTSRGSLHEVFRLEILLEQDTVLARQYARQIAGILGFDTQDQVRIGSSVSEIVRNAMQYAGHAKVFFFVTGESPPLFLIRIEDQGPGIPDLKAVLDGRPASVTGKGQGLMRVRRLMDEFNIGSAPRQGTRVDIGKYLPRKVQPLTPPRLRDLSDQIKKASRHSPYEEMQNLNQELMRTLEELRARQTQLEQINVELDETNRGVVALYAELDERAESIRRVTELKTRFFSNMSHEFRTPISSIVNLTQLLLDMTDGPLTPEQEKQVSYIRKSGLTLAEMVNDLLDMAKYEAGQITLRPEEFQIAELFMTLRGMLRPLITDNAVSLIFEESAEVQTLHTDEGKLSQILRNLISNALKFTSAGEVRVSVQPGRGDTVVFSVADTGIGIAPENRKIIFEEFKQIESAQQKMVKGTGLGLPLSRKLAELLGGSISLTSEVGKGSVFSVEIPVRLPQASPVPNGDSAAETPVFTERRKRTVLIVDDDPVARYILRENLPKDRLEILERDNGPDGLQTAVEQRPDCILLDLVMPGMTGHEVLERLRENPVTRDIPVIVCTSKALDPEEKQQILRNAGRLLSKHNLNREMMAQNLDQVWKNIE